MPFQASALVRASLLAGLERGHQVLGRPSREVRQAAPLSLGQGFQGFLLLRFPPPPS